jgi:TrmH family RNA methyltransferase
VQHLRRLSRRRSARTDSGAFVIDGPVLVAEALDAGLHVSAVYVELDEDGAVADHVAGGAERAAADGALRHTLAPRVLSGAVETVTPHGMAAVAAITTTTLDDVAASGGLVVVLAGVSDPGNAGTLLRSAEAAGASGVIATAGSVDLFSPKVVRASAGSLFRVPVAVGAADRDAVAALQAAGSRCLGTAAGAGRTYDDTDLTGPVALVLGNESHGLDPALVDALDATVAIPMAGAVESLNVAMAGTVLLFESARQRRR